jgi:hypothetical protein
MTVEIKKPHMSIEEMDKAILREAAGCSHDDDKAKVYEYSYQSCVLFLSALAKKLLGIFGIAIGNDPRRALQLGFSNSRDFHGERERLMRDEIPHDRRKAELDRLRIEEQFATKLSNEFDGPAWEAVIELFDQLYRRSMALERAGLVRMNVDNLVPEAAAQREVEQYGGDGKIPCDGTVEITSKGLRAIASQKWPKIKQKQRPGTQACDQDVEVPT